MPDWFFETLNAIPAILWMILGVGLPWALIALPRQDWHRRVMVACVSLGFGPALVTAWMFILGTLGQNDDPNAGATINPMQTIIHGHVGGQDLMRPEMILGGTAVIALLGFVLAWLKMRRTPPPSTIELTPLALDERILIGFIILATLTRWWISSWLPFGSWDPMWVYGYQGRMYTLLGYIPADIGYYPQFLSLQYAYTQIVSAGDIADHAARAVLPFLQVGSIMAAYLLGSRLFNRRTGIFTAALWALYPHFGYWTRVGDLEIPVTFSFTGSAAFFLLAWTQPQQNLRRSYAIIAGLFLGIAMWTKPTAGGFIWGVILLVGLDFLRVRGNWRTWMPHFEVAFWAGLASIPLGAVWYLRNLWLGHDAILLPPSFWPTLAVRGGSELGWPLLALLLLLAFLYWGPTPFRPGWRGILLGSVFIALAVSRTVLEPARMNTLEWLSLIIGLCILAAAIGDVVLSRFSQLSDDALHTLQKIGWAWALGLPYFLTWFYSYSYHYRLSFAIVPLMILPSAVILAAWFKPQNRLHWRFPQRSGYAAVIIGFGLYGTMIAFYDEGLGWDWLWTIPPEDDYSKAGLLGVVDTLETYIEETGEQPVVYAPGLQPLPFFFPLAEIHVVEIPRSITQINGATHFIGGRIAVEYMQQAGDANPFFNQWYASLARENVVTLETRYVDDAFSYDIYRLHPQERFNLVGVDVPTEGNVIFGDFGQLVGHSVSTNTFGTGIELEIIWEGLAPADDDYNIFIHLIPEGEPENVLGGYDGPVARTPYGHYSTLFWEQGEIIIDRRILYLPDTQIPPGDHYRLNIGFYDAESGERVPVMINGEAASDSYVLETAFVVPP